MRPKLKRDVERREHRDHEKLALADRQTRARENPSIAVRQDPLGQIRMVGPHPGNHPLVERAVDPAAERLPALADILTAVPRPGGMGGELLEDAKRIDRPGVAGERDQLEEGLVEAPGGLPERERGPDLPAKLPLPSLRRRDRDPGEG
jgi:hypothetical protein